MSAIDAYPVQMQVKMYSYKPYAHQYGVWHTLGWMKIS